MPSHVPLLRAIPVLLLALVGPAACTPADVVPGEPMALDGSELLVEALPQQPCDPDEPYAIRVRWSVSDWDDPKFDFRFRSSQGQLWARENRAGGEMVSGAFVRPGLWLLMVDRNSGMVVAATPAPALACPDA